jgi:ribosomal-protein-serine acetyltransferase
VTDSPPILRDFPSSFDTARLTLRRPEPGDGEELNAAIRETHQDLHEWMPWAVRRPPVAETEEFVRKAHAKFVGREDLLFLIFLKGMRTIVGGTGLHRIDWRVPSFEIGSWCRKHLQGQGYITEAAGGLADFAERELGARRLVITCDAQNERSAAIPPRIGFVREATLRNHIRHHLSGELRDTLVFARVRSDGRRSGRR